MSKRVLFSMVCLVLALGFSAICAAESVEAVEAEIGKLWDKVKAYSATVEMNSGVSEAGMSMTMQGKGTTECMKKGEALLYRMDLVNKMAMGEMSMDQKILSVYDGEWLYSQLDMMGMPMVLKLKPSLKTGAVPGSGKAIFKMLHESFDLAIGPEEQVDGKAAYVFLMTPKEPVGKSGMPGMPRAFNKAKICFSKETGIQVKMAMIDEESKPLLTIKYKDIKVNPAIAADRFSYTPPDGVQVMDMNEMGKMMGGAR